MEAVPSLLNVAHLSTDGTSVRLTAPDDQPSTSRTQAPPQLRVIPAPVVEPADPRGAVVDFRPSSSPQTLRVIAAPDVGAGAPASAAPPMAKLVEAYAAYLGVKKGRARSPKHVAQVTQRVLRMVMGATRLEDVTPEFIESRMHELLAQPVGGPRGKTDEPRTLSRHTVDGHRRELGTFFRWLQKKKKLVRENPVDQVDALDREEPRDVARAFSAAELEAFFQAVPEKRRVIYLFWATTGLRPQETRRIVWGDVVLDGDEPPHIRLRCSTSKNQQRERQPLHPVMADLLRKLRSKQKKSVKSVFEELPNANTFAKDLKKAGLEDVRVTPEGKLTAYSLRKTFITSVVSDEKNSTMAHKLARHSDPRLTFGTYTSFDLRRKAEAVANLPLPASVVAGPKSKKGAGRVCNPLPYHLAMAPRTGADRSSAAHDRQRSLSGRPGGRP